MFNAQTARDGVKNREILRAEAKSSAEERLDNLLPGDAVREGAVETTGPKFNKQLPEHGKTQLSFWLKRIQGGHGGRTLRYTKNDNLVTPLTTSSSSSSTPPPDNSEHFSVPSSNPGQSNRISVIVFPHGGTGGYLRIAKGGQAVPVPRLEGVYQEFDRSELVVLQFPPGYGIAFTPSAVHSGVSTSKTWKDEVNLARLVSKSTETPLVAAHSADNAANELVQKNSTMRLFFYAERSGRRDSTKSNVDRLVGDQQISIVGGPQGCNYTVNVVGPANNRVLLYEGSPLLTIGDDNPLGSHSVNDSSEEAVLARSLSPNASNGVWGQLGSQGFVVYKIDDLFKPSPQEKERLAENADNADDLAEIREVSRKFVSDNLTLKEMTAQLRGGGSSLQNWKKLFNSAEGQQAGHISKVAESKGASSGNGERYTIPLDNDNTSKLKRCLNLMAERLHNLGVIGRANDNESVRITNPACLYTEHDCVSQKLHRDSLISALVFEKAG
jgi:hypothetical protein